MGIKQTTVRIPEELMEAVQKLGTSFNDVVIAALERYLAEKRRESAIQMAAELRQRLRERGAPHGDASGIIRHLRERGRDSE